MARIEDTGGNITITIDNCDCGLTGGCWKCQPIHYSIIQNATPIFIGHRSTPFTYQEFVGRLREGIDAHPEWGVKYI